MKEQIIKMEVNNEIEIIKSLLLNENIDEAQKKCNDFVEKIFLSNDKSNPVFNESCKNVLSVIIIKACKNINNDKVDVEFIIKYLTGKIYEEFRMKEKIKYAMFAEIIKIYRY